MNYLRCMFLNDHCANLKNFQTFQQQKLYFEDILKCACNWETNSSLKWNVFIIYESIVS